jgi:hypothetical protein
MSLAELFYANQAGRSLWSRLRRKDPARSAQRAAKINGASIVNRHSSSHNSEFIIQHSTKPLTQHSTLRTREAQCFALRARTPRTARVAQRGAGP